MSYDDSRMSSDRDYLVMKANYNRIFEEDLLDLKEILSKMQGQKQALESSNTNHQYDNIIEKLNLNIADLDRIIAGNTTNIYSASNYKVLPRAIRSMLNIEDQAISPIRSREELIASGDYIPSILPPIAEIPPSNNSPSNTSPNITPVPSDMPPANDTAPPSNDSDMSGSNTSGASDNDTIPPTTDSSSPTKPTNMLKRNRPMPSNPIYAFARSLNLNLSNLSKNLRLKFFGENHSTKTEIMGADNNCDSPIGNQIDIVHSLLLYIDRRPTHKYISKIINIAYLQFESLVEMLSHSV